MEALSLSKRWKGYSHDLEGSEKLVFSLKEPKNSCTGKKNNITISTASEEYRNYREFEITGDFPNRNCSIVNSNGSVAAEVRARILTTPVKFSLLPKQSDLLELSLSLSAGGSVGGGGENNGKQRSIPCCGEAWNGSGLRVWSHCCSGLHL